MDFFEHQEQAKGSSTRLVILFGLAVVAPTAILYLSIAATLVYVTREEGRPLFLSGTLNCSFGWSLATAW